MNAYCNCISRDAYSWLLDLHGSLLRGRYNYPLFESCRKCGMHPWTFIKVDYEKQFLERLLVLECKEQERDALETLISEEGSIE